MQITLNPLRVLFISPYLPSLIHVRPYNLIKHLARRGHQITLLAVEPPGRDSDSFDTLRRWCHRVQTAPLPRWRTLWNGLTALPQSTPFQAAYSRSPAMTRLIRQAQAAEPFDVAHVEHLRGAELSRAVNGIPTVFDSVDSISLLFERLLRSGPTWRSRLLARLDLARTRRYEGSLPARFARVLVTSPQDRDALAALSGGRGTDRLLVLPNGVNLEYFSPQDVPRDTATLVFSGKMSYHANVAAAIDLASRIMPHVWAQMPEATLTIAGKDPAPEVQALAANPRITVTGTVPDLRPYLARAAVAVSPMRYGVGIQNKVLEAMAMGTPVVTAPQTLDALQVEAGRDLLAADSPPEFAAAIVTLLNDRSLWQRISQAGRRYVETRHSWDAAAATLETIYRDAIIKAN